MALRIKDWNKFQHFKDRRPPWIKLYRDILDDVRWHELDGDAAKLLVMLWVLASETDGYLPDIKTISFRLRRSIEDIQRLICGLDHWLEQVDTAGDISVISLARSREEEKEKEKEEETETETEEEKARAHGAAPPTPPPSGPIQPNNRAAAISILMRSNGIHGCNSANPIVQTWADDPRVTDDLLLTAAALAKDRKAVRPGPGYLDPIVKQLLDPPKPKPSVEKWWRDNASMQRKARELGLAYPDGRPGEEPADFEARIKAEIRKREGAS